MAEKILITVQEMETEISKFQAVQAHAQESMRALQEAVHTLAALCDDPALPPLVEPFERLLAEMKKSRQIMDDAVDVLAVVVSDLVPCGYPDDWEPVWGVMLEEGPKPDL